MFVDVCMCVFEHIVWKDSFELWGSASSLLSPTLSTPALNSPSIHPSSHQPPSHPPSSNQSYRLFHLPSVGWGMEDVSCLSVSVCVCPHRRWTTVEIRRFHQQLLTFHLMWCCHSLCDWSVLFTLAVWTQTQEVTATDAASTWQMHTHKRWSRKRSVLPLVSFS